MNIKKTILVLSVFVVAIALASNASAIPVTYKLLFSDDNGSSGNGHVSIDSFDLALMPETGFYDSPVGYDKEVVKWLGATVNGIFFDNWRNGVPTFMAVDGKLSGVTTLAADTVMGPCYQWGLGFDCELDIFNGDNTYRIYQFDENMEQQIFAQGVYTMWRVPVPGSFILLVLGLIGLGVTRKLLR